MEEPEAPELKLSPKGEACKGLLQASKRRQPPSPKATFGRRADLLSTEGRPLVKAGRPQRPLRRTKPRWRARRPWVG